MNNPKISIITACYNAERTIAQTIESVLSQSYENIEYIIVDGNSKDSTLEIVNRYKDKIDIIISEPDKGVYDAFNKGLNVATGDYIYYLNADDYLLDNSIIQTVAGQIIENNIPDLIYGGVLHLNEQLKYVKRDTNEINLELLRSGKMIPHQAVFTRRDLMIQYDGFKLEYKIAADFDLICRLFSNGDLRIVYMPVIVAVFRLGGLSSNKKYQSILYLERKKIISNLFNVNFNDNFIDKSDHYYKLWIAKKMFNNRSISDVILEKGFKNIAIFSCSETANLIAQDCYQKDINVLAFLDNDTKQHGLKINGVEVLDPSWLIQHKDEIDVVIFGYEGDHDTAVLKQLASYSVNHLPCFNWKFLVTEI